MKAKENIGDNKGTRVRNSRIDKVNGKIDGVIGF